MVVEAHGLAVPHGVDMDERRIQDNAGLAATAKPPDDRNVLTRVNELLCLRPELIEILRHGTEDPVHDCLRTLESALRRAAAARLVPLNLRVEPPHYLRDVLPVERFVAFPDRLHILLRHGSSSGMAR